VPCSAPRGRSPCPPPATRTPADRIAKLNEAVIRILQQKEVADTFAAQGGIVPPPLSPLQVADFVRGDVAMWRKLVSEEGIQAD
jgi:tripartite-type tricarboxylate transporter receptor subunit TctC